MNVRVLGPLLVLFAVLGIVIGAAAYFGKSLNKTPGIKTSSRIVQHSDTEGASEELGGSAIQDELNEMSNQLVADLRAEQRVNLNMVSQLRTYRTMLNQIQGYAQEVEKQLDIIGEISKEEFQEDVKLQASLFNGKKPDLVAKHLEEYKASRVGAILAKMKEKEASKVLDIWAKSSDPRVSAFYRETMASYLNNRRRDMHPHLFDQGSKQTADVEKQTLVPQ